MNTVRRLGLLTIATTMVAMPLTTGIAGAAPEEPKYEAVAPTDEAQLPDDFSAQYYNGEDSSVAEFPFIIAGLRTPGVRPEGQSCTGSVIAPRKILTAAHCKDAQGEKSYLYGLDDLTAGGGTRLEVESYIQHPKYINFDQGYDVAVVTTKQDIPVPNGEYAEFATSAPKYDDLNQPGKTGTGVGYGKKTHNDNPPDVTVDKAELPIVDGSRECTGVGAGFQEATMVCAGYPDGSTTILPGDSGGPLIVDGVVVGVGSWSRSDFRWYSVYSRLNNDMGDWVKQQVGEPQPPEDGEFALSVVPGSVKVEPGGAVSATVRSTAGDAGAEEITLSASGLPADTEAVFQPATVTAGKTAKLTLDTATSTPEGTSTVTITGTAESGTKTAEVTLTVGNGNEQPPGDISLSLSPASGTVQQGFFGRTRVTATGGDGPMTLTADGAPGTVQFSPNTVSDGQTSTAYFWTNFQTRPGTYPVTITATDSTGATARATYTLTITSFGF